MPMTQTTVNGPAQMPQRFWSVGDYDRLASYGSAAEAAHLVRFAAVRAGDRVLDVGTGSGIVAIVAAQRGARAIGVDPTNELLAKARENARIAGQDGVAWHDGVAEALPFPDASFDVVLSQYAHMFSPRPQAAAREMLRVLRPGGFIAFAAWTPQGLGARLMELGIRYSARTLDAPSPSPFQWGDPHAVQRYLGEGIRGLGYEHRELLLPALSPGHARVLFEETFPPTVLLVRSLADDPARLAKWREEYDRLVSDFHADGAVRFEYLLTRATKT
jgi:ubiquinone/menaquinone biosynthesis C-methylase UbiE